MDERKLVIKSEDEAPSSLRSGYLLPSLRRERNPSEAENSSRSSTSLRSRFSAKGDKRDLVSKTKTIYEAGPLEIFWKNFLAGFSRGLGGVFVYIIFLLIISGVIYNFVLPKFMPEITNYLNLLNSISSTSNIKSGSGNIIPENLDIQKLLGK